MGAMSGSTGRSFCERERYAACLVLVNACPSTKVFQRLIRESRAMWLPARRINFIDADGLKTKSNRYDQAMFLIGGDSVHEFNFASALQPRGAVLHCSKWRCLLTARAA